MLKILLAFILFAQILNVDSKIQFDDLIRPAFSCNTDQHLLAGSSYQLNCSLTYKQLPTEFLMANCTEITFMDKPFFEIDKLKILRCINSSHCLEVNTVQLDNSTVSFITRNLSTSDTGSYLCQYNGSTETADHCYMKIGYKPVGPNSDDISCMSVDLMNITCSWKSSQADINNPYPVFYSSYFVSTPLYGKFTCPHAGTHSCTIYDQMSGEDYTFSMYSDYTLYVVTTINVTCIGRSTVKHKINLQEIVKLSPPVVTHIDTGRRNVSLLLNLALNSRKALNRINKITYEVSYRPVYLKEKTFLRRNISKSQNITLHLMDLIPFTKYSITIKSRGYEAVGDQYWSIPVTTEAFTKPAAPDAIPKLSSGGFSSHNGITSIYVKPISSVKKNAATARYNIAVMENFTTIREFNVSWENSTINIRNISRHLNYTVEVKTVNDIGESRNINRITLPAISPTKAAPLNVVVEKLEGRYMVRWKKINTNDLDRILLYWCRGENSERQKPICKSNLNWTEFKPGEINLSSFSRQKNQQNDTWAITDIKVPEKGENDWVFAVAYEYNDGYNTGMVFPDPDCYFLSLQEGPVDIPRFSVAPVGSSELSLKPVYCSRKYNRRPLTYTVLYKEADNEVDTCDSTFYNKTVMAKYNTRELLITDLNPSTFYALCLSVLTVGGHSRISKPIRARTTTRSVDVEDQSYIIVLAVFGGLFLLSFIILVIWKVRKSWIQPIEFILPKINFQPRKYVKVLEHDKDQVSTSPDSFKLVSESCTDSGLSVNNYSNKSSSASSVQDHKYSTANTENKIDPTNLHVTQLQPNASYEVFKENTLKMLNSEVQNEKASIGLKERSASISTATSGYTNFNCRSSHTTSSVRSSLSSNFSKRKCQKPSVETIFGSMNGDSEVDGNKMQLCDITEGGEINLDSKLKYVRDWVTKSTEDLQFADADKEDGGFTELTSLDREALLSNNPALSETTEQALSVNPAISEYVEVDVEGSVKTDSSRSNENRIQSEKPDNVSVISATVSVQDSESNASRPNNNKSPTNDFLRNVSVDKDAEKHNCSNSICMSDKYQQLCPAVKDDDVTCSKNFNNFVNELSMDNTYKYLDELRQPEEDENNQLQVHEENIPLSKKAIHFSSSSRSNEKRLDDSKRENSKFHHLQSDNQVSSNKILRSSFQTEIMSSDTLEILNSSISDYILVGKSDSNSDSDNTNM